MIEHNPTTIYGTTIVTVRKDGKVVIAGDGQVSLGNTVMKGNARKVRRIGKGNVIAGFAGTTADAFTLLSASKPSLNNIPTSLCALRWNWPRTGAPTATCANWKP